MFAYCDNNPVMKCDFTGEFSVDLKDDDNNPFNDYMRMEGGGASGHGGGKGCFGASTVSSNPNITQTASSSKTSYGLDFKTKHDLDTHFNKHGKEFDGLYSTPQEYLEGANYVINNGTYVSEMNGYIRYFGANGRANYAFAGLTHDGMYITTFSIRSVYSLNKIPWIKP